MRKTLLFITMICIFLLSGCSPSELPENEPEAPPSSGATETLAQATKQPTETEPPAAVKKQNDIRALFPDAGENDLLAVVGCPESSEYIALCDGAATVATPALDRHLSGDTLLVPLKDGVRLIVEQIKYDFNLNWFIPIDEPLLDITANAGEAYALHDFLTVDMPDLRVTVEYEGLGAILYNQYGDEGEFVSYLEGGEPAAQPIDEFSNILPLSIAVASYAYQMNGLERAYLPAQLAADEIGFWQIIAHAITLAPPLINRDIDPYSGEPIPVPEWMVACYADALYPGITDWPEVPAMVTVDAQTGRYDFEPVSYGDYLSCEYLSTKENPDGSYSVFVSLFCEEISPDPTVGIVTWEKRPAPDRNTPFEYRLVLVEPVSVLE